jgi:hypothetical protein
MSKRQRMPIKAAKEVADLYGQDQVILLSFDKETGLTHVVTYGKTVADCEQAAIGGNRIKEFLGFDASQCRSTPRRVKESTS